MCSNSRETVWSFYTKRFAVKLSITQELGYEYDGDDEDGETQRKLNDGEYIAFNSLVTVYLDGAEIAGDSLCGSVYADPSEFWTGEGRDGYFRDMVREACRQARVNLANPPQLRNPNQTGQDNA